MSQEFKTYKQVTKFTDAQKYKSGKDHMDGIIHISEMEKYASIGKSPLGNSTVKTDTKLKSYFNISDNDTKYIIKNLNLDSSMIIAGGCVVDIIFGVFFLDDSFKDIDIFMFKYDEEKIKSMMVNKDINKYVVTDKAVTAYVSEHRPIQFIRKDGGSISDILYSFDFAICQCCIWKGETYMTYECAIELTYKRIYINKSRSTATTYARARRYMLTKGCSINFDQTSIENTGGLISITTDVLITNEYSQLDSYSKIAYNIVHNEDYNTSIASNFEQALIGCIDTKILGKLIYTCSDRKNVYKIFNYKPKIKKMSGTMIDLRKESDEIKLALCTPDTFEYPIPINLMQIVSSYIEHEIVVKYIKLYI